MVYKILVLDKDTEGVVLSKDLQHLDLVNFVVLGESSLESAVKFGGYDAVAYSTPEGKASASKYISSNPTVLNLIFRKSKELSLKRDKLELSLSKNSTVSMIEEELFTFLKNASVHVDEITRPLAFDYIERLNEDVVTVGFEKYMQTVLNLSSSYFNAPYCYWLGANEFDYYIRQMWKVHRLGESFSGLEARPRFISMGSTSQEGLADLLQRIQGTLPKDWATRKSAFRIDLGPENDAYTVILPVYRKDEIMGQIFLVNPDRWNFPRSGSKGVESISKTIGVGVDFSMDFSKMEHQSYHDDVTNLYNQRYLKTAVEKEIDVSKETGSAFSVLFIDIDHFKKVNDTMGHVVGSRVLVEVGKMLGDTIRKTDYGFRYGGDEFLLLLSGMDSDGAAKVAERIRRQVESEKFRIDGNEIHVTLSIGVASYPEHAQTWKDIVRLADQAMYHGKAKSRNIIVVAS